MAERNHSMRGFTFSVDALLAIVVLSVLMTSISFFSARAYPETYSLVNLQVKTNDVLVVLDKMDYLSGMNASAMAPFINSTFGPSVAWWMDVEYYNYTQSNNSFSLAKTLRFGDSGKRADDIAATTRVFIVKNSTAVIHYGRVSLMTWLR